jgi:hypothetical protein
MLPDISAGLVRLARLRNQALDRGEHDDAPLAFVELSVRRFYQGNEGKQAADTTERRRSWQMAERLSQLPPDRRRLDLDQLDRPLTSVIGREPGRGLSMATRR